MDIFLIKAAQLILSLSILVVLHELGHFIPAKLFKTRVEKFFLFFDVKFALFKKKIGETVYGIGWLPLGGYVKIAGMIDESMDKEQMAQPAQPWEFRSKPAWQRLIIMIGGVTVNLLLGFFYLLDDTLRVGTRPAKARGHQRRVCGIAHYAPVWFSEWRCSDRNKRQTFGECQRHQQVYLASRC